MNFNLTKSQKLLLGERNRNIDECMALLDWLEFLYARVENGAHDLEIIEKFEKEAYDLYKKFI